MSPPSHPPPKPSTAHPDRQPNLVANRRIPVSQVMLSQQQPAGNNNGTSAPTETESSFIPIYATVDKIKKRKPEIKESPQLPVKYPKPKLAKPGDGEPGMGTEEKTVAQVAVRSHDDAALRSSQLRDQKEVEMDNNAWGVSPLQEAPRRGTVNVIKVQSPKNGQPYQRDSRSAFDVVKPVTKQGPKQGRKVRQVVTGKVEIPGYRRKLEGEFNDFDSEMPRGRPRERVVQDGNVASISVRRHAGLRVQLKPRPKSMPNAEYQYAMVEVPAPNKFPTRRDSAQRRARSKTLGDIQFNPYQRNQEYNLDSRGLFRSHSGDILDAGHQTNGRQMSHDSYLELPQRSRSSDILDQPSQARERMHANLTPTWTQLTAQERQDRERYAQQDMQPMNNRPMTSYRGDELSNPSMVRQQNMPTPHDQGNQGLGNTTERSGSLQRQSGAPQRRSSSPQRSGSLQRRSGSPQMQFDSPQRPDSPQRRSDALQRSDSSHRRSGSPQRIFDSGSQQRRSISTSANQSVSHQISPHRSVSPPRKYDINVWKAKARSLTFDSTFGFETAFGYSGQKPATMPNQMANQRKSWAAGQPSQRRSWATNSISQTSSWSKLPQFTIMEPATGFRNVPPPRGSRHVNQISRSADNILDAREPATAVPVESVPWQEYKKRTIRRHSATDKTPKHPPSFKEHDQPATASPGLSRLPQHTVLPVASYHCI